MEVVRVAKVMKKLVLVWTFSFVWLTVSAQNADGWDSEKNIFQKAEKIIVSIYGRVQDCTKDLGLGFIVGKDGVIATTYSNIAEAESLTVRLNDGSTYPVEGVIYYNLGKDLILLKTGAYNLPVMEFVDSSFLGIGDSIYCLSQKTRQGYEFSLGVLTDIWEHQNIKMFQFTAPTAWESLGSPLITQEGEVAGIVSSVADGHKSLNLALSSEFIQPYVDKKADRSFSEFRNLRIEADYYFEAANQAFVSRQYQEAIDLLRRFIALEPKNIDAYNLLGLSFFEVKNYRQAIDNYNKILELSPDFIPAHNNLALIYLAQGQSDKAIVSYKEVLQIAPDSLSAWFDLARLYGDLRRYQEAAVCYKRILELNPYNIEIYSDLGWVYGAAGEHQKALDYFKAYTEFYPDDPEIYFKLGLVYLEAENKSKAKENLTRAENLAEEQGRVRLQQNIKEVLAKLEE